MSVSEQILRSSKTVAVVGLSSDPDRSSHGVASYLQKQGYRIIPVNPKETEILGEVSYARLEDIPEPVDVVNVFRRAELTPDVVRSAIAIGAKAVWLQLGIANEESRRLAEAAGVPYVEDTCIAVAHRFLK
jgi:predicted CoA-binding protein